MYQAINGILSHKDTGIEAAEAHGIAVGMISVELQADAGNWLMELVDDGNHLLKEDKSLLLELFEQTRHKLNDGMDEFSFDLFLPGEEEPLNEQVEALRAWCQGFIFGVGYARHTEDWPGEIGEVMRDMFELTSIDSNVQDEEDANALMEIHEYIRAAVFTVRDYFMGFATSQGH